MREGVIVASTETTNNVSRQSLPLWDRFSETSFGFATVEGTCASRSRTLREQARTIDKHVLAAYQLLSARLAAGSDSLECMKCSDEPANYGIRSWVSRVDDLQFVKPMRFS